MLNEDKRRRTGTICFQASSELEKNIAEHARQRAVGMKTFVVKPTNIAGISEYTVYGVENSEAYISAVNQMFQLRASRLN
jgi:hypothetical protein